MYYTNLSQSECVIALLVVISVTGIVYWLRFFYFKKSDRTKEFQYSVYFNHADKEVRIHNHEQQIPKSFERITTLTSKDGWIRRGIMLAFSEAQKKGYMIVISSEFNSPTNTEY